MRTLVEVLFFRILECVIILGRIVFLILFIRQALKHTKYQGNKSDIYTIITFMFLAISIIFFICNRIISNIEVCVAIYYRDDEFNLSRAILWQKENEYWIRIIKAILRICLGYLFQSLALLVNINRWVIILMGGQSRLNPNGSQKKESCSRIETYEKPMIKKKNTE